MGRPSLASFWGSNNKWWYSAYGTWKPLVNNITIAAARADGTSWAWIIFCLK